VLRRLAIALGEMHFHSAGAVHARTCDFDTCINQIRSRLNEAFVRKAS